MTKFIDISKDGQPEPKKVTVFTHLLYLTEDNRMGEMQLTGYLPEGYGKVVYLGKDAEGVDTFAAYSKLGTIRGVAILKGIAGDEFKTT